MPDVHKTKITNVFQFYNSFPIEEQKKEKMKILKLLNQTYKELKELKKANPYQYEDSD